MKIILNGKVAEFDSGITLAQFVAQKGLNPATLVIEHNGNIIARDSWTGLTLCDGDRLEIVAFVGGG